MADDKVLSAAALRAAFATAERWLALNRDAINAINVYPVPDGDTGTNMLLTLRAGLGAGEAAGADAGVGLRAERVARGALLGARGNSGVILSQMIRGGAEALAGLTDATAADLARAIDHAANAAYEAVSAPVEGTMLTVLRAAARAVIAEAPDTVLGVLMVAEQAAQEALARTPQQLPRLREAGVVDAGGLGVVTILAGLRMAAAGEELPAVGLAPTATPDIEAMEHSGYGYCTEYVLQAPRLDRQTLIRQLEEVGGESILVVGDLSTLHVHVHVLDPGPALSAGAALGSLHQVKIDNMQAQHEEWAAIRAEDAPIEVQAGLGLVAVARGAGIAAAFRGLGAVVALPPDDARPSSGELLEAVRRTGREHVLLLPNDSDGFMAAEQAARESGGVVVVIPSRSVAQGLSAAVAFNSLDSIDQAQAAMTAAMGGVRCVEATRAARATHIDGRTIEEGQAIALVDGRIVAGDDLLDDAFIAGLAIAVGEMPAELITVYLGSSAPIGAEEVIGDRIQAAFPDVTVEIIDGGQPHYPYIAGVE
ncbi:MAG: DAK2 domain-containing protein [Dehalococcoidia bacterium]